MVSFELRRITDDQRKSEEDLQRQWEADLPSILGGLLTFAAKVHAMLPKLEPQPLPRMADFAVWSVACERGAGEPETFVPAYADNQTSAHEQALDASPIVGALLCVLAGRPTWSGSPWGLVCQ